MLGYVRKSKVSGANSAANTVMKAINTALVEIDEEDENAGDFTIIQGVGGSLTATEGDTEDDGPSFTKLNNKVKNYMDKCDKYTIYALCEGGVCQAVGCHKDATYTGTSPQGVVNVDNYKDYSGDAQGACEAAYEKLTGHAWDAEETNE
jgi:type IV pilus assembly protein PilA